MTTESALSVYELERLFKEEVRCEFTHKDPSNCGGTATHRVRDCKKAAFVCAYGAERIFSMIEQGNKCMHCLQSAFDCWQLRAI